MILNNLLFGSWSCPIMHLFISLMQSVFTTKYDIKTIIFKFQLCRAHIFKMKIIFITTILTMASSLEARSNNSHLPKMYVFDIGTLLDKLS